MSLLDSNIYCNNCIYYYLYYLKIIREQIIYILNNGMEYWIKWK